MLSDSSRWYPLVPKSKTGNAAYRKQLWQQASKDYPTRLVLRKACEEDILFWINCFCMQYNPKKMGQEAGPFITWEFQDRAVYKILECVEKQKSLLIEKSREMGASWLIVFVFLWLFLYKPYQTFLMISRDKDAVDGPSRDSLFAKFDFILERMPEWLLPVSPPVRSGFAGMNAATDIPGIRRIKFFFENLENHSEIHGEAPTENTGVGGRATAIAFDEFSRFGDGFLALGYTASTASCRIFNSTHKGTDTAFHFVSQREDIEKLVMHWTEHPDKNKGLYTYEAGKVNVLDKQHQFPDGFHFVMEFKPVGGPRPGIRSPWYDGMCAEIGHDSLIARDLDINPSGSINQYFNAVTIHELIRLSQPPWWQGRLEYDRLSGKPDKLVADPEGNLSLWCQLNYDGLPARGVFGAGADISQGIGHTPSCLAIGNVQTGGKVAQLADPHIFPNDFAILCRALLMLFLDEESRPPLVAWEKQGPGAPFSITFMKLHYPRAKVYHHREETNTFKTESDTPGWNPQRQDAKRILIDEYQRALRTRDFFNPCREALETCLSFGYDSQGGPVWSGARGLEGDYGARVNHGDLVVMDALCWMCMKLQGKPDRVIENPKPPLLTSLAGRIALHEALEREYEEEML